MIFKTYISIVLINIFNLMCLLLLKIFCISHELMKIMNHSYNIDKDKGQIHATSLSESFV